MPDPVDRDELYLILTHPAFVSLTRVDVFHYLLAMTDPRGHAWAHHGPLMDCVGMALFELPLTE